MVPDRRTKLLGNCAMSYRHQEWPVTSGTRQQPWMLTIVEVYSSAAEHLRRFDEIMMSRSLIHLLRPFSSGRIQCFSHNLVEIQRSPYPPLIVVFFFRKVRITNPKELYIYCIELYLQGPENYLECRPTG